jgi:hypothetical protein
MEAAPQVTRLTNLQELADQWRLSPHTIRAMVREGKLRPVRICRRLLFDPRECERFLEASGKSTEQEAT